MARTNRRRNSPAWPQFTLRRPTFTSKGVTFALVALLAAGAAMANAAVNMLQTRAPEAALAVYGNDPVALIRAAQVEIVAGDASARTDEAVLSVVQRSVRALPINGPAFRLYGLNSAANANLSAMRAQMRISDRMERRDVGAQLWLIENAVEQNDVTRALRHYDTALRIEESSRALLYPVLTDALESGLIRERFVPYMKANPPWLESFLRYAVSNTSEPVALAQLARLNGGWPAGAAFSSLDTELLARLFDNEDYTAATDHFRAIDGVDRSILDSVNLTDASTNWKLAPIAWQPFKIEGIETFILASPEGGGKVEIEAELEAGYKGPVARKYLALKPGRYRLTAAMRAEDYSNPDQARWALSCVGRNGGLSLVSEDIRFDEAMTLEAQFTVPANCPVQYMLVSAETLVTTQYVKLILASAELTPQ